jgi:hypothetical protein
MAKDPSIRTANVSHGDGSQNLYVEPGETVMLAPDSQRFSALYKRVYPSGIDEVRAILGLSDSAAQAISAKRNCQPSCAPATLHTPEDLTSHDKTIRQRAKEVAVKAAYHYVTGTNQDALAQWKPLLDRYIEIGKVAINYVALQDIEIADRGTLIISAKTNALNANNIKIHGSGRMVCQGHVSIKCVTLQGITKVFVTPYIPIAEQIRP